MRKVLVIVLCLIVTMLLFSCEGEVNNVQEIDNKEVVVEVNNASVNYISVEDLLNKIEDVKVVDTRASYVYNGWSEGTIIGGHIPSAVNFSTSWLEMFEDDESIIIELVRLDVNMEDDIVLYGTDGEKVYNKLSSLEYNNLSILENGFESYADGNEISKLKNYEMLVHANWLNDLITDENIDNYSNDNFMIFEASWGAGDSYEEAHIPGAIHINTDEFEEEPIWNRKSDKDIEEAILANGITTDTTVIVYGPDATPASRIAVILKYAGVKDVRVLDGGFNAWKMAGHDVETGSNMKVSVDAFGAVVPSNPGYIIDMEEAKEVIENGNLISIRGWAEFIGETSGYSYIEPKGRIAGSIHGQDTASYRNIDGTMFNYELMAKDWAERGIVDGKANSFYCGTGWRAAETLFYADLMGMSNISLYDGGWYEWSSIAENPVEVGEPK